MGISRGGCSSSSWLGSAEGGGGTNRGTVAISPAPRNRNTPLTAAGAVGTVRAVGAGARRLEAIVAVMVAAPARRGPPNHIGGGTVPGCSIAIM